MKNNQIENGLCKIIDYVHHYFTMFSKCSRAGCVRDFTSSAYPRIEKIQAQGNPF